MCLSLFLVCPVYLVAVIFCPVSACCRHHDIYFLHGHDCAHTSAVLFPTLRLFIIIENQILGCSSPLHLQNRHLVTIHHSTPGHTASSLGSIQVLEKVKGLLFKSLRTTCNLPTDSLFHNDCHGDHHRRQYPLSQGEGWPYSTPMPRVVVIICIICSSKVEGGEKGTMP